MDGRARPRRRSATSSCPEATVHALVEVSIVGEHVDVVRLDAERVGDDLRADGAVALALRRRPDPHGDPAERGDDHGRALGVARLRQRLGALLRGLRERDVAHVRDRRLDDAGDADPDQPALRPWPRPARRAAPRSGRARARRRGRPRSRRSRRARRTACGRGTRRPGSGCAARSSAGSRPSRRAAIVHRPLEREVELRPAEAAVEPGRAAVRRARRGCATATLPHAVGARERAVHPVERRRLGGADVGADVLDDVVARRASSSPSPEKPASHRRRPRGRAGAARRGARAGPRSSAPARRACARRGPSARCRRRRRLDPEAPARVARRDRSAASSRGARARPRRRSAA